VSPQGLRDVAMFLLGAGGFIHEVLTVGVERPFILTACLALMGLPFILTGWRNGNGNGTR
jgi:hypothetical protein